MYEVETTGFYLNQGTVRSEYVEVLGEGPLCGYKPGNLVRCEVIEVDKTEFKIFLSMKAVFTSEEVQKMRPLGLLGKYDVPSSLLYAFDYF